MNVNFTILYLYVFFINVSTKITYLPFRLPISIVRFKFSENSSHSSFEFKCLWLEIFVNAKCTWVFNIVQVVFIDRFHFHSTFRKIFLPLHVCVIDFEVYLLKIVVLNIIRRSKKNSTLHHHSFPGLKIK